MFNSINLKKVFEFFLRKIRFLELGRVANIPNFLSIIRIFLIVPFFLNFINDNYKRSLEILIWSGITDFLDGFFARFLNQRTKFGEIIDPVADKLTLISIMICVGMKINYVKPFIIILGCKEICMMIFGAFLIKNHKKNIKAKWYGKLGTAFFYISLAIILFFKIVWGIENKFVINTLMILTTLLMIYAMIRYFIEFISIVRTKRSRKK